MPTVCPPLPERARRRDPIRKSRWHTKLPNFEHRPAPFKALQLGLNFKQGFPVFHYYVDSEHPKILQIPRIFCVVFKLLPPQTILGFLFAEMVDVCVKTTYLYGTLRTMKNVPLHRGF